jgi:hypothetical protein
MEVKWLVDMVKQRKIYAIDSGTGKGASGMVKLAA